MTRYEDMMQKMTVERLARLIAWQRQPCEWCVWKDEGCIYKDCAEGIKKWLNEEKEIKDQGVEQIGNCYQKEEEEKSR